MGGLVYQSITWMHRIGMIEYKKAGPKFLFPGMELMLDIHLHVSGLLPQLRVFLLGRGVFTPVINILQFHLSTVPVSQTDLVLHPRMEGERSTTMMNSTDACLPILD